MQFRIADTFTDALARLTGEEQKAVKTTAFDLQMDPSAHGLRFHKLDRARDKQFWSVRVNADVRIIVHRTQGSLLLCFVGHHDKAYEWAERRKLEVHPTTGAAQLVEVRERIVEVPIRVAVEARPAAQPAATLAAAEPPRRVPLALLATVSRETLLAYGVPAEWIDAVQGATEDSILDLAARLPAEAAEAVLVLATGGTPAVIAAVRPADPFEHPDALRRFRVMTDREELERALDFPWDRWSVFLHPAQRALVERHFEGPARVAGSAGTGKSVVALHRAVHLARANPQARVLVTTFSVTLARMLRQKLRRLTGGAAALEARITVEAIDDVGVALYERAFGTPQRATDGMIGSLVGTVAKRLGVSAFSNAFLVQEWREVVDAWQVRDRESYQSVPRLGRRTRLGEKQRSELWTIFEDVRKRLHEGALFTSPMLFDAVSEEIAASGTRPFDFVVVDEAQDVNVPQLRFLAALAGDRPDGLFFAGDLGQRIFQWPFSWKALGVDVRGRSATLKVNYRTSHQIRRQADRLLAPSVADVDGNVEERSGAISVFEGPEPEILVAADPRAERKSVV